MRRRRYPRIFSFAVLGLFLALACLMLGGYTPTASAHAFVIGSDPVDGSTVQTPPQAVRIFFDAPISPLSRADIYAFPPGAPTNGLLVNAGSSVVNSSHPNELDTPLIAASRLPTGGYEVRWTALSNTDGHGTSGLIGFNLGQSSLGLSGTPLLGPSTSNHFPMLDVQGALAVAWDWLVLSALLFWIGLLITDAFIIPRTIPSAFRVRVRKQAITLQAFCLLALLAGEIINAILRATFFAQEAGSSGIAPGIVAQLIFNTTYGHLWLMRIVLICLALLFLWWTSVNSRRYAPASLLVATRQKRFSQLRRQVRQEAGAGTPTIDTDPLLPTPSEASPLARSQPKIAGTATASIFPAHNTNGGTSRTGSSPEHEEHTLSLPPAWHIVAWFVIAGLLLLTLTLSNEIIQLASLPISAGVFSWLSLAAQALWFGCMAYLGLIALPLLPASDPDRAAENAVIILRRALAPLCIAASVLLVSELFLGEATIHNSAQLFSDPYGRALLVRFSLLLLMVILTAYTLLYLLPRLQQQTILLPVVQAEMPARRTRKAALERTARTITRALRILTGLAAASLLCVAVMNFFAPPVVFPAVNYASSTTSNVPPTPVPSAPQTQHVGDLTATLQVLPASASVKNTLTLTLSDAQGKAVRDAQVKLSVNMEIMDMGVTNATITGGSPAYVVTFNPGSTLSMSGPWAVQVEVDRPHQPAVQFTFHVLVSA